ncbi:MAG TPA: Maf family nucleotide pyrophosphatase [Steroidobacteraceae bacterium]
MFLKSPPQLILASTSRYRKELLARLGLPFACMAPGVDETPAAGEEPLALISRLAKAKAAAVAAREPKACVVGSDQVAVLDAGGAATVLGKPGTEARCQSQLRSCSGRSVEFLTAVAVMHQETNSLSEFVDRTRVRFRVLDEAAIERYVAQERPLDCAGGFKSEGLGITLCESIESADPTGLIGLPLIRLSAALRAAGFALP